MPSMANQSLETLFHVNPTRSLMMADKEISYIQRNDRSSSDDSLRKDEETPQVGEQDWTPEEERKLVCVST